MALTYNQYLHLDTLLAQQCPLSDGPEHDEWLFITVHQVYELWFKQILVELEAVCLHFQHNDQNSVLMGLKRILTILKTLVSQIDILETITPLSFLSFRARLDSASGLQSEQFRHIEFILGARKGDAMQRHVESIVGKTLLQRSKEPSLWDALLAFLARQDFQIPNELLMRDVQQPIKESEPLQEILIDIYRQHFALAQLLERLVDLDEGMQEWRYRHVKMVERTIGTKKGTGGSEGVAYLRTTLFTPFFADLWAIRSYL